MKQTILHLCNWSQCRPWIKKNYIVITGVYF